MFQYRGIIEGFYGKPWTHEERLVLLKWMGKHGYTHYMYAPKADTYHRTAWRKPYPDEEILLFQELVRTARASGVTFSFALSPGLSLRYSAAEDRETLYEKIAAFAREGVGCFGLFFDDIPEKLHHEEDRKQFKSLAAAQAFIANELYRRLQADFPQIEMIFCPTVYCGHGEEKYLVELGKDLDPAIEVYWTGPQVCSRKIELADMAPIVKALQRKPIIWDNYPVNDASMVAELHIGPYIGRGADLAQALGGFFLNPMNQFFASLITLDAIGEYLKNPTEYNVIAAWERGVEGVLGQDLAKEFMHFAEYNLASPIHEVEMSLYHDIWKKGEAKAVQAEAAKMKEDALRLRDGLKDTPLGTEIAPWLKDFLCLTEMALTAAKVQAQLRVLMLKNPEDPDAVWAFVKLQIALNRLRRKLRKYPDIETAVTGGVVFEYCARVHRSVEKLLQVYVDRRGTMFKYLRWILRRF